MLFFDILLEYAQKQSSNDSTYNKCYEGETIRFVKRPSEEGLMEIGALNEEGKVCFMAAVK